MVRWILISLLLLSLLCLVPMVGAGHSLSGHFHHGMSVSCATCVGATPLMDAAFILTLLGLATILIPVTPPLAPVRKLFHPPRVSWAR